MGELKLVQIDAFFDSLSAYQAQNWLDQEGVIAFVEDANANAALYVGSALSGVKLLVAFQDQERARRLLLQYHSQNSSRTTWYCGECKEFNEPSFDLCWSCGKNREDVEVPAPTASPKRGLEVVSDDLRVADIPEKIESDNPYQPPLVMLPAIHRREEQADTENIEQTEEVIQRAWRASILGLILPIPLLQLYSIFLLLGVDGNVPISKKSKLQFKLAWSFNIFVVLIVCLVVRMMANRF